MEKLFNKLSVEDKGLFFKELSTAMNWRGWDAGGKHQGICCHACGFIKFVEELGRKYGMEFLEYS